ncbi:hypothetical protein [Actibacterium pelagium]|uniref:Uncharacterized protein n=1 Tax=Actibacterium pelagium TaxID=2029103 RepID=A0A917AHP9_9RHOB|nr:hypothetical protein [Actibacterium pelagium]GGE54171.1 hypothetical protein GCM10011517_22210 [Actibacterium pelagium]
MTSTFKALAISAVIAAMPAVATAQSFPQVEDRFWILWEKEGLSGTGCPKGAACVFSRDYRATLLSDKVTPQLQKLFQQDQGVYERGRLGPAKDAPHVCQQHGAVAYLETNPELQLLSDRLDALRGLVGVGLDLRKLKPPPGESNVFGQRLHEAFTRKFRDAGLIVVSPDESARLPGQPKFNLFFSFSDDDSTCEYTFSVFASLSQTALLSRDLRTKLSVGVWSFSTKPKHGETLTEYDAILRAADAFLEDFKEANAPGNGN